jgi:hypothetical protein
MLRRKARDSGNEPEVGFARLKADEGVATAPSAKPVGSYCEQDATTDSDDLWTELRHQVARYAFPRRRASSTSFAIHGRWPFA